MLQLYFLSFENNITFHFFFTIGKNIKIVVFFIEKITK